MVYEAEEVHAGKPNLLFVRWHNLGLETIADAVGGGPAAPGLPGLEIDVDAEVSPDPRSLLSSAPATIYHDVPEGAYALGAGRVDDQGGVFVQDWNATGSLPPLPIPPTAPDVEALLAVVEGLPDLLGGLDVPGLPEIPGAPGTPELPGGGGLPGLGDLPDGLPGLDGLLGVGVGGLPIGVPSL